MGPLGKEIPSQVLEPQYWDGHSFEDGCGWTRRILGNPSPDELAWRKTMENDRRDRSPQAYQLLKKVAQGPVEVVETLTSGVFDGLKHPPGTIVRIHSELMKQDHEISATAVWRELINGNLLKGSIDFSGLSVLSDPEYFSAVYLGVLMESPVYPELHRMRVMRATQYALRENMYAAKRPYEDRAYYEIGKVGHERFIRDIFEITGSDTLTRVTKLEVLGIQSLQPG